MVLVGGVVRVVIVCCVYVFPWCRCSRLMLLFGVVAECGSRCCYVLLPVGVVVACCSCCSFVLLRWVCLVGCMLSLLL